MEVASDLMKIFVSFLHINYYIIILIIAFTRCFVAPGKALRHRELENTAVFYDDVGIIIIIIIFFSDRNSRWILHIEIICDDVYTYHQPKQKKCQSKYSAIT